MDTFLRQVASRILREHPRDTDRVLVVFNNHRSELFLRRAFERLSAESGSSFFLPHVTVIDDLVAQLGGLKIVPNEFLLFELYRIHMQIGGNDRKYQTFEDFIAFGDMMLRDFSEIDRYCVDARRLFVNLHDIKDILEWDVENPSMSPFQHDYLLFYQSLHDYYCRLRTNLAERGEAYGGMAYRHVAENIADLADRCPFDFIYFVGFNALSECEKRIILEYERRGRATLLTDADIYYYSDPMQEAGLFLRRHETDFPELAPKATSLFSQGERKVHIVECPEGVLQCKYVGRLLDEHRDWLTDPESTAVVLADESLLIPTLDALPVVEGGYSVNVTMGYPFADSGVHALIVRLFSLYRRASASGYYHADLVEVLGNHLLGRVLGRKDLRRVVADTLRRESRIRSTVAEIRAMTGTDTLDFLFPDGEPSPDDVLAILRHLAEMLAATDIMENNKKEKQALGGLAEILDYFDQLQQEYHFIADIKTLEKVYTRIAQRHNIAFRGEPLSGLQVLGVLETRNLDFRRVILLSANEGTIPAGRSDATLIPFELQRHFHLPTYEEKDAVYAYNFYRLLQRAEEVTLLYSSESAAMGKGEESRFLKQVRHELAGRFPEHVKVDDLVVDLPPERHATAIATTVPKDEDACRRIAELAGRGFSPSALNVYIGCPLSYHYKYIKGLRDDSLDDSLDASQLGSAVHSALQHIYTPYLGSRVDAQGLRDALATLPQTLDEAFAELYRHGRPTEGRNRFLYSVAESQVRHILTKEIDLIQGGSRIEIVALEQELSMPIADGVSLSGVVDRIDRVDGRMRVVDYKTGSVVDKDIAVKTADLDDGKPMPGKWFQLMCYALLYSHAHPLGEPLLSGIYPLRSLRSDVRLATTDGRPEITAESLNDFRGRLGAVVAELMDPAVPFAPPQQPSGCSFCPAKGFCPEARLFDFD